MRKRGRGVSEMERQGSFEKNAGKILAAILIEMERNDPVSSGHGCLVKDR